MDKDRLKKINEVQSKIDDIDKIIDDYAELNNLDNINHQIDETFKKEKKEKTK